MGVGSETKGEITAGYVFIGLSGILCIYILISAFIHTRSFRYLHPSLVILAVAAIFSYVLPIYLRKQEGGDINDYKISPKITPDIVFNYILPPIIMSAGFNMRKKFFFRNLSFITLYGFFGTVLNFVIVSGLLYWINPLIGIDTSNYYG